MISPLTNTSFLVILLPAFLALITVLMCCSGAGLARRVAFCQRKWRPKATTDLWNISLPARKRTLVTWLWFDSNCSAFHLYTERRCRSSLRWSSHRCSQGRTPLYNRGRSCTSRFLRESRRRRTFHFHDRVSRSLRHRLDTKERETFKQAPRIPSEHLLLYLCGVLGAEPTNTNKHAVFWFIKGSSSPLQSGPNVPFGQHTLMVSMQNHLCRSGCFVFLQCKRKQNRKQWGLPHYTKKKKNLSKTQIAVGLTAASATDHLPVY